MKNMTNISSLVFTVGVHGDEHVPVAVACQQLPKSKILVCHRRALSLDTRFVESDLNRSFPGKSGGTLEENIARKLLKKLKPYRYVVDLHTATCATPPFIIITKVTKAHIALASRTGVNKMVIMNPESGAGKSLIDFVPVGISLESGREKSPATASVIKKIITRIYSNLPAIIPKNIYMVTGVLVKNNPNEYLTPGIRSFKLVSAGTKITNQNRLANHDFYPIFPRSRNYPNFLCQTAQKINLTHLNVKI